MFEFYKQNLSSSDPEFRHKDKYQRSLSYFDQCLCLSPPEKMVSSLFLLALVVCGLVGAQPEGLEARVEKLEKASGELGEPVG